MVHVHAQSQQILKMNGVFARISPEDFQNLMSRNEGLMIVASKAGIFGNQFQYLTSYKGLIFYCRCGEKLSISSKHETLYSESVSIPTF
jgi:hypothetical protein